MNESLSPASAGLFFRRGSSNKLVAFIQPEIILAVSIYRADLFPADLRSSEAYDLWIDVAVGIHGINSMETDMSIGTVKWFNSHKGYGFIQPEQGGKDVFVHASAVERAGLGSLNEGQRVNYEIARDRGKESAANLSLA